jgi:dienelactone hydrolase
LTPRSISTTVVALVLVSCSGTSSQITIERKLEDGPSFSAYLVSYLSDDLKVHAMVAVPNQDIPEAGFPVVIANHGYVPEPARYGISAAGIDSRPGDYYRSVPELYASRGFLVVLPDYRGHNDSEGFEFVHKPESVGMYAEDVVALMMQLDEIENADLKNVFLWSHSMGGGVSIRVQLATDLIRGASYWATTSVDDQTGRLDELTAPIVIQHSSGDKSTDHSNSERFQSALKSVNHPVTLYTYGGPHHYFEDGDREQAADRDAAFFRGLMR